MKLKFVSTSDPPANKSSNRLTRTSSANRTIKSTSTSSSHGNTNFKIKLKHGISPSRNSGPNIHGCRTQTRSSTSSAASTSRGNRNHGVTATATSSSSGKESAKEMKKSKDSGNRRCNCICANCGLSIDDSGSVDNDDHRDVSLIREPINLGTKNVRQILQCVHNGTPEIKDIVLNECNIIYECRICRNLFRSLANLLSHKRYYCKDHKCENMLLFGDKYLTELPEEDNLFMNSESNIPQTQHYPPSTPNIRPKSSNDKTTSEQSSTLTTVSKTRNRRKQEMTFAGPVDGRIDLQSSNSVHMTDPQPPDNGIGKVGPEIVASKRKHLESCVNKLLYEKSPKLNQLTIGEDDQLKSSFTKQSEETIQPVTESLNMNDNHVSVDKDENSLNKPSSPISSSTPPQDEPILEIELPIPPTSTSVTTNDTQIIATSAYSVVFNIDENANHPVAGEESESNMQEIVSYPQSISSLVSDDGECSRLSEMFPSGENSEMESIDVDGDVMAINNKEASQQSLPSSSSSPSSSSREHSSNHRNKPKTFDDTYETKPSPISTVPCSMCNSKFSSKKTLNVHIQTIHNVQRLIYPCPFCCLTFKQLFNATRHMIQVHRKGKTQVKFLREAVKRRAYPEVKSDENGDESVEGGDASEDGEDDEPDDTINTELTTEPSSPLEEEEEENGGDDEDGLILVPIGTVGEGSQKEVVYRELIPKKSKISSSSSSNKSSEVKSKIKDKQQNSGDEVSVLTEVRSKPSTESNKKEAEGGTNSNQEKVRRVNPIIFSCINNCGEYFIKSDSKAQHEKKCSKPDDDDDDLVNQEKSDSSTSHNHHHHHHHRSRDGGLDLNIITDSIYKELEKVGNLTTRRCNHCPDLQFKTKSLLILHLIVHIGYELLKCKKCAYQTLKRTEMDSHLASAHGTPEILRGSQIVNLSTSLSNDTNGSAGTKASRIELKEDNSQESTKGNVDEGKSEKSNSSGIVLHLRPKLSRSRKKKKIYEVVVD